MSFKIVSKFAAKVGRRRVVDEPVQRPGGRAHHASGETRRVGAQDVRQERSFGAARGDERHLERRDVCGEADAARRGRDGTRRLATGRDTTRRCRAGRDAGNTSVAVRRESAKPNPKV
jgi:hypothetical protein